MRNFFQRVIVIPEKLTTLAMIGIMWVLTQFLTWLTSVTGIDFGSVDPTLAALFFATILTMLVKAGLEMLPEKYHNVINSFLAWLATLVVVDILFKAQALF